VIIDLIGNLQQNYNKNKKVVQSPKKKSSQKMDAKAKSTPSFPKMDEIAKFGWKYYVWVDAKHFLSVIQMNIELWNFTILTPKIPWNQKLVDCCLGSLCEEI
jgi:hypothetical protein